MPYEGGETLIFKSENGFYDTIFLNKKDTLFAYPEAPNPFGNTYECLIVSSLHSSPSSGQIHRYLENVFYEINADKENDGSIKIQLKTFDATFYQVSRISLDSLMKIMPLTIKTEISNYDDVYIFSGEDFLGNLYQRDDFVTKLYWSKSRGLIRYDKKDGKYWELVEVY